MQKFLMLSLIFSATFSDSLNLLYIIIYKTLHNCKLFRGGFALFWIFIKIVDKFSSSVYNLLIMNRISEKSWIVTKPIAHRGLHDEFLPENSKAAYENAIENGYPIEMDIQLTKDGELVCFHDDNMVRMTGVDALVCDKTLAEIKEMRLAGTPGRAS